MAGTIEAARVLTKYSFPTSIIYVGLSGEEQGLYGGRIMAEHASGAGWHLQAVLNNDMIGNIEGVDGVIDNYNASTTWAQVLAGTFDYVNNKGGTDYWRYLGQSGTVGATTGHKGRDTLIVFSGTDIATALEISHRLVERMAATPIRTRR